MKKLFKNNKGFSLIELIVVIAILGVLVGVAAPQLIKYVENSRVSTDLSNLEIVRRAATTYIADKEAYPATVSSQDLEDAGILPDGFPALVSKQGKSYAGGIEVNVSNEGVVEVLPSAEYIKSTGGGGGTED